MRVSRHRAWLSVFTTRTWRAREGAEKREPSYTVGGTVCWCSHCGNSMEFSQKIKNSCHMIQQCHSWDWVYLNQNSNSKKCMHIYVHSSTVYSSQDMEATWISDTRIDEGDAVHTHTHAHTHTYIYNGILLCHKENEIMPFVATWIDLQIIILSEVSQKKTNTIQYHLYTESKIWHKWTYL